MSNDIFFLGAGFSKAIDNTFPTLSELSQVIKENLNTEKESVGVHYRDEIPYQYKDNIETLLTFLSSKLPYKTDVQVLADEALYKDIARQITTYFENKKIDRHNDLIYSLGEFIVKEKITSISLNYDILLEEIILNYLNKKSTDTGQIAKRSWFYDRFYNIPITNLRNRVSGNHYRADMSGDPPIFPKILKLHGSINWLYTGNGYNEPVYCKDFTYNESKLDYLKEGLSPMIIPPVLDKSKVYNHIILESLWKQAFEKIKNAKNIYVYGFSFPPTDLSIRFLFQSALSNNCNVPNIYIINTADARNPKSPYYLEDRFKEIFKGYNINFDFCCENSLEKFVNTVIKSKNNVHK